VRRKKKAPLPQKTHDGFYSVDRIHTAVAIGVLVRQSKGEETKQLEQEKRVRIWWVRTDMNEESDGHCRDSIGR
jgi:nicotinic acid mononucleotide adenylyltransferase